MFLIHEDKYKRNMEYEGRKEGIEVEVEKHIIY